MDIIKKYNLYADFLLILTWVSSIKRRNQSMFKSTSIVALCFTGAIHGHKQSNTL